MSQLQRSLRMFAADGVRRLVIASDPGKNIPLDHEAESVAKKFIKTAVTRSDMSTGWTLLGECIKGHTPAGSPTTIRHAPLSQYSPYQRLEDDIESDVMDLDHNRASPKQGVQTSQDPRVAGVFMHQPPNQSQSARHTSQYDNFPIPRSPKISRHNSRLLHPHF